MWTNLKCIQFLTFLIYMKCHSNVTVKAKQSTSTKTYPNSTHKLNVRFIEWQSVTGFADVPFTNYTKRLVTSVVTNGTKQMDTSRTWIPVETTPMMRVPESTVATNITTESNGTEDNKMCKNYKRPENPVHVQDMADIWQILYYQMPGKLQCFRIHIRKVSEGERISYKIRYGTFNDKVNWTNVLLEIRAMTHSSRKRHFLQGNDEDDGVMMNIVIIYDKEHFRYVFHEESSDQWLVYRNLLLMRDCDTEGVVVFSKVPHLPLKQDINYALKGFGEVLQDGRYACENENNVMKYYEEDDKDL